MPMSMLKEKNSRPLLNKEAELYRAFTIKAAKELGYSSDVVYSLERANSEGQMQRIMVSAREGTFYD